jgi:hypothetical protein
MARFWAVIRRAKELWSWYSFIVGVSTLAITGVGLAVGGTVWLVKSGIPLPLALMAGYCTFVGAAYLAMAPLAYRALSQNLVAKPRKPVPPPAGADGMGRATHWSNRRRAAATRYPKRRGNMRANLMA